VRHAASRRPHRVCHVIPDYPSSRNRPALQGLFSCLDLPYAQSNLVLPIGCATGKTISIGKLLCAPRDLGRGFNERSYPAMLAQICSAFHGGRPILRIGWRLPVLRKSKRPSKQSQLEDRRTCNTPTIWQLSDLSILYSRRVVIEVSSCYNRSMSECGCTTTAL